MSFSYFTSSSWWLEGPAQRIATSLLMETKMTTKNTKCQLSLPYFNTMMALGSLPVELMSLVISFCDFPTAIQLLRVNKYLHSLALPVASNIDLRIEFLLDYESSIPNRIQSLPDGARQTVEWHEYHLGLWRSRRLYICFLCLKLRQPTQFAEGQCFRMMLPADYTSERKRFCIECGIRSQKYVAGSMIKNVERGYRVLLCGECREWTPDFYCMREKRCFRCTEKTLLSKAKFVEGFEPGTGNPADDQGWIEQPLKQVKDASVSGTCHDQTCIMPPVRPPCCRSCGDHWRYTPAAFERNLGSADEGTDAFHRGYIISGRPKMGLGPFPCQNQYMSVFCPYPMKEASIV